jgi:hypothetical protein
LEEEVDQVDQVEVGVVVMEDQEDLVLQLQLQVHLQLMLAGEVEEHL